MELEELAEHKWSDLEYNPDNTESPTNHFKTAVYSYGGEVFGFIQMKVELLFIIIKLQQKINKMK